ncbi:MAG: histidine phosphatase family protein [Myxococcales bacterium]|nr:histidine phosphatase family protein [Myxococcales bacterium]
MSAFVEITLVRHGQSESNVTGRWQGQGDSALSEHGREQAFSLAARLVREGAAFDRWLSSDLQRAHDTGLASAARLGATLEVDPTWREIDVGAWEGLTNAEVEARFPEELAAISKGEQVPVGGGESWADLAARAHRAFEALRGSMRPGERAVVFTHGGVIAALLTTLLGVRRRPRALGNVTNTGVTTIRFEANAPLLVRFNDHLHLGGPRGWSEERREGGAALISVLTDELHGYTQPPIAYDADELDDDPFGHLASSHAGERVALRATPERATAWVSAALGPSRFAPIRGVTHVVASERGYTLADLSSGGPESK